MNCIENSRPGSMDKDIYQEIQGDIYQILRYVKDGDTIIDVGANVGYFALFVKHSFPNANIICIEPIKSNVLVLKKNVEGFARVIEGALMDKNAQITIYDFGLEASACHSIYNFEKTNAIPTIVNGYTLKKICDSCNIDHINFLKMDVQGAEYEILPAISLEEMRKIDYLSLEVHFSIARTGETIGIISDYKKKRRKIYDHLKKTHVRILGSSLDTNQVWANKNIVKYEMLININDYLRFMKDYLLKIIYKVWYKIMPFQN